MSTVYIKDTVQGIMRWRLNITNGQQMDTELIHQEHLANNFLEKPNKWIVNICLNQA